MEKIIVATRWLVFFQAYIKRDRGILWSFAASDMCRALRFGKRELRLLFSTGGDVDLTI
ncbi:hypothetical protein [Neobacillus vireti]|uniref:hypothetical protein n=1 Tax=Neobacillus vireti TaxID=220686 RepID=UPI0030004E51